MNKKEKVPLVLKNDLQNYICIHNGLNSKKIMLKSVTIKDFVDSINIQLKDLVYTSIAKVGYAKGISNIIINGLSNLSGHNSPLRCSYSKREVLYIKDNGE